MVYVDSDVVYMASTVRDTVYCYVYNVCAAAKMLVSMKLLFTVDDCIVSHYCQILPNQVT